MSFFPHLLLAVLEGAVAAATLALTALGLSLVFGVMRVVNVAHGEFYMLGAMVAWWLSQLVPAHPLLGFLLALIGAPLAVGAVAFATERLVLRRIGYDPEATIVATIGLMFLIQQLALSVFGADAKPVNAPFTYRIVFPWFGYSGYKLFVVAASAVLLLCVWWVMSRTRFGLIMRVTQFDRETATAFGIPVGRVYSAVFVAGAAIVAIAAVLLVPIQQAHYLMGLDPLLMSFIVVIIGGLGSLKGSVIAALAIGLLGGIVSVFFSPTFAAIIATLLVAFILVIRPQGFFGAPAR
ncbi:MAG: branched-chain amino acid ABC transporter permease [Rhizobiales bacterium]|nr:branched-chain amino acid ABC transporter permease [Hyphomicrobiales bacterium]MBI3672016.1 branched-chain amino acid ABC transporter permease [Hyphomicrobiales bacterium]